MRFSNENLMVKINENVRGADVFVVQTSCPPIHSGIIELLIPLPGSGRWTAEMFLIFALGRLDIFSEGSLALRVGVQRVVGRSLTRGQIEKVATRWSPYRSVASLYLWKISHWKE